MLFGSELFEEYIGQLAMASMSSLDVFGDGEQIDSKKLQDKMRVPIFSLKKIFHPPPNYTILSSWTLATEVF